MTEKRIIAFQPDLFGAPEKPCYAWRRAYWTWTLGGELFPLSDDAIRQNRMLGASGFEPWPNGPATPRETR